MLASSVHSVETHSTSCTVSCFSWLTDESESRSHGNSHFSFLRSLPGKISDEGRPSAHHMSSNSLRFNIILGKRPSALINGENFQRSFKSEAFFRVAVAQSRRVGLCASFLVIPLSYKVQTFLIHVRQQVLITHSRRGRKRNIRFRMS